MENENLNEQLEEAVLEFAAEPEETATVQEEALEEAPAEEAAEAEEAPADEVPVEEEISAPAPKKNKTGVIVLTAVLCLLLGVCLTVAVLAGTGVLFQDAPETTVADTTEPETTVPVDLISFTVDAETAVANADKVVATIGDVTLTNGELQTCYQMGVYNFLSANQYYLSYMNVDFNQPLDKQVYSTEPPTSWQEFLLNQSLDSWKLYTVLNLLGQEAGFELDDEGKAYLADMEKSMQETAEQGGYESLDAMLQVMVAPGTTAEGYKHYMALSDYAYRYYSKCAEDLKPTLEELEVYYNENEEALIESGIKKDAGNLVDVRHILIKPEGGTTDENNQTVYSDAEWEACRQKAQDILDQWKNGEATEESFGALAKEHTADGNGDVGGLYESVPEGYMVTEFNDWIFDESRKYGDTDLVKTQFGYHVMYFVDSQPGWISQTEQEYVTGKLQEMVNAAYEKWPMEVDYDVICLGEPKQG